VRGGHLPQRAIAKTVTLGADADARDNRHALLRAARVFLTIGQAGNGRCQQSATDDADPVAPGQCGHVTGMLSHSPDVRKWNRRHSVALTGAGPSRQLESEPVTL